MATASGVLAAPLAVVGLTTAPAHAAPSVEINLVAVNDFHGRINTNTTKWATTVEAVSADTTTPANTLMVGAGDLIGASEFASAIQDDQPTIDVMNTLGLDASAVGNHEFDKGWADLRDRVIGPAATPNATWDYLASNVTVKATGATALKPYQTYVVDNGTPGDASDDVTVGVVGGVTDETPSLVSPAGVAELQFSDEVAAAAKYADILKDGNTANGEADVVVATFHSGAAVGAKSSFEAEVAKGGVFARMASMTGSVDAIINGHTHQTYAWQGPKPGGGTRAYIQTGEYAANVGQIKLTVDAGAAPGTNPVTGFTVQNVARAGAEDLTNPRVADVKQIVDAALANAKVVGDRPVGAVTADISRAYDGVDASGKPVEDRGSESPLGDLVANALRDGVAADIAKPDLGIVNPGGLRADLVFKGDTATNPANTDGVITFAEANNVLPFVNNISTVALTGAQVKKILEQQWQPVGSQRPFLHLGLSDNVQTTLDPAQPVGQRVTSVRINGAPLDLAKTYSVSTFSFLAQGGDNFTAFTEGKAKDTGLIDRDLWVKYLSDKKPVSPDFAREQIYVSGLKDSYHAGDKATIVFNRLDMLPSGVKNTRLELVKVRNDGTTKVFGTTTVTGGQARAVFTVRGGKEFRIVAQDSKTTLARGVVLGKPTMAHKVFPTKSSKIHAKKTKVRIKVKVKSGVDLAAKGRVTVKVAGRKYNAKVKDGVAKVKLRTFAKPGKYKVVAKFLANDTFQGATDRFTIRVKR
ncbi:bifunctional metallophosphatase/5'-nucleotidase [Nocardioides sp. Soil805]|uniref:bifunctional metallophosphatase/5'-nucleotidase n=1 Tax=Nocardioides sp. Soil805 TaxID=1736416 RepID=UPI00138F7CDF|nr:5'-nucleotidase C-terminal domain-containing protein [Nocardioides sp. Soil805]